MNMSRQSTTEYYSDTVGDFETPTIESIKSINPDITGPSPAKIRWMDAFQKVCRQLNQVRLFILTLHSLLEGNLLWRVFVFNATFIGYCQWLISTIYNHFQALWPQESSHFVCVSSNLI